MAEIFSEPTGAVLNGTDAANPVGKPAVDVILDSRGGEVPDGEAKKIAAAAEPPIVRVLARLRAQEAAARGEAPALGAEAEPAVDTAAEAAAPDAETDPEAPPAEPEPEAKADEPADVAALRAEAEIARTEVATLRHQLLQHRAAEPSDGERRAWIDDPVAVLRGEVARRLRVPADHAIVDRELAGIQRELTIRAIGDSNLDDTRRAQRANEHTSRRYELDQHARQTDQVVTAQREARAGAVRVLASVYEQAKADYPALVLAADLDGRDPADIAMDTYLAAVRSGQIRHDLSDAEASREALRLTNQIYLNKADKVRRHTAPAQASTPVLAASTPKPGAPNLAPSAAAAKPAASASPRTLSAKQAAAAPAARAPGQNPRRTIVVVDPNDRDSRDRRAREIAERRFKPKP